MNFRLLWHRLTHHLFYTKDWLLIIGQDISDRDYGVTLKQGEITPIGDWKRWKYEFRMNVRWPISIRFKVNKT